MSETKAQQEAENPYAKATCRPFNEPFKLFGVLDWRYVFVSAVPSVFGGMFAHSKLVFLILLAVLSWTTYGWAEEDPALPLVWWATILDKSRLCPFRSEGKTK
jgi:hypothetical protein